MRTWVADLGNSTLFVGVFAGAQRESSFRVPLAAALAKGGLARQVAPRLHGHFDAAALCSVIPAHTEAIAQGLTAATGCAPALLTARSSGLRIAYRRPSELGHDRLACALGARTLFPKRDVVVVDCGTATTVTAVSREGTIQGGAILPGLSLWADMLALRTAQLPKVVLDGRPPSALGQSTRDGLRAGIVLGHVGAIRELTQRLAREAFGARARPVVVGTGGHAPRFVREKLFTVIEPELILTGLNAFAEAHARHD
jgi:type III pantothenate kinase